MLDQCTSLAWLFERLLHSIFVILFCANRFLSDQKWLPYKHTVRQFKTHLRTESACPDIVISVHVLMNSSFPRTSARVLGCYSKENYSGLLETNPLRSHALVLLNLLQLFLLFLLFFMLDGHYIGVSWRAVGPRHHMLLTAVKIGRDSEVRIID